MFLSPPSFCVSFSFKDDLGTPPTWRPHSWKKNPFSGSWPISGSSRVMCTSAHAECLPAMLEEISSQDSTPVTAERSLVLHLILVTLAGEEIQLPIELQEFDRFMSSRTQCEKLRVATLHGRLPTSPGSLAHNRLSHSSGTVRNLSFTLPNTSENFKCCTSCSQTLAPFSHTSQTNWP